MYTSLHGRSNALRFPAAAAAGAAMVLVLTACGPASDMPDAGTGTSNARIHGDLSFNDAVLAKLDGSVKKALQGKNLDGINLAMVVNTPQGYWIGGSSGFSKALSELGVKGSFKTPRNGEVGDQLSIIRGLRSQGVSAFSISAIDTASLRPALQSAASAGIPVLAIDSPLPAEDGAVLYLGTPNYEAGRKAGEAMKAALGGRGRVAVLVGSLTALNAVQRIKGFEDALKGTGIQVVEKVTDQMNPTTATSNTQDVLDNHPDVTGIYCVYSYDGPAAASAVWAYGRAGKVKVVSDDADPQTLSFIHQGVIQATIVQSPYQQGYTGAYLLAAFRVLGKKRAMDLIKPYLSADGALDSGIGVVTRDDLVTFTERQDKLGITE